MSDTILELEQPTLLVTDNKTGGYATFTIIGGNENSENNIFIKRKNGDWSEVPILTMIGPNTKEAFLAIGEYYAKVESSLESFVVGGLTDPVYFRVSRSPEEIEEELTTPAAPKNIDNVNVESITNPFYGNQFIGYFLKIPQVGYYQDSESKTLKSYITDRINESIRSVQLPETSIDMISVPYFGHQNTYFMGVGSGELGQIILTMKMDRYMQNYASLLNWSYLKYDWTFGGKNPANNMDDRDLLGTFVMEFIDADEEVTRKIAYKVIIDTLAAIDLTVENADEIEFQSLYRITDVDTSKFVMGEPLSERTRIL